MRTLLIAPEYRFSVRWMTVGQSDWSEWLLQLQLLVTYNATTDAILDSRQTDDDTDPQISFYTDQRHCLPASSIKQRSRSTTNIPGNHSRHWSHSCSTRRDKVSLQVTPLYLIRIASQTS